MNLATLLFLEFEYNLSTMKRFFVFVVFILSFVLLIRITSPQKENVPNIRKLENSIPVSFKSTLNQPLEVTNKEEIKNVNDEDLKNFILSKVDFQKQKVLYFEWQGSKDDYLMASLVYGLEGNDKKYLISMKKDKIPSGDLVSNKQIFIVSLKYPYQIDPN